MNPNYDSDELGWDKITFSELKRGSGFGLVNLNLGDTDFVGNKIILNLSYFPGFFKFVINGQKADYSDCGGLVCLDTSIFKKDANIS